MKNEFVLAFNEVLEEKQLPKELIQEALEAAMVSAYRRSVNASNAQQVDATIDLETGKVAIFAEKEVVETVQDPRTEVTLEDSRKINEEAQLGDMVIVESTPKDFGRVAAQTARQVIQQRIREAERDAQMAYFNKQTGEIVSGVVQAVNAQGVTLGLDMKAEGVLPRNHMILGERFRVHDRVRALLLEVKNTPRGPQIVLSRAHRNFLKRSLENEVPEIFHGMVEIRSISREPGQRSKVAVSAVQAGVDPVGACVGIRGVRIQAIVRELNDEKIDVIEWSPDPVVYIAKALSPARVSGVYLNEHTKGIKTATVVVPEDQLSLAIGRDGQNARLAAKLTSWRIDIKSLPEATSDAIYKLQNDPEYARQAEEEADVVSVVEHILAKKAEGRPVTPEEYQTLNQFVDRIERGLVRQREKELREEEERQTIALANIPPAAFEMPLEDLGIPLRFANLLSGAGFVTVGDLLLQMRLDPNEILKLEGIGAKAMEAIEGALANLSFPEPVPDQLVAIEEEVGVQDAGEMVTGEPVIIEGVRAEVEIPIVQPALESAETIEAEIPLSEAGEEILPLAPEFEEGERKIDEIIEEPTVDTALVLEEGATLDELFTLRPEVLDITGAIDDEDEDETDVGKKKKKKGKKFVEVEYDPEKDVTLVKKKRKRGEGEWEGEW